MSNNLLTFHLRVGLATINSISRLVDRALDSPSILRLFAVANCITILPFLACDVKEKKKGPSVRLELLKIQTRYQCPVCRS